MRPRGVVRRQMGIGLLSDALEDDKGLRPVQPFAAPGRERWVQVLSPLLQPLVEHVSVLSLDGDEALHVPALPKHIHKPLLVILGDIDSEEFTNAEAGPEECGNEGMIPEPLICPPRFPHAERLRGIEQPELLEPESPFHLGSSSSGAFTPSVGQPRGKAATCLCIQRAKWRTVAYVRAIVDCDNRWGLASPRFDGRSTCPRASAFRNASVTDLYHSRRSSCP